MSVNRYNSTTGELERIAGGTLYADLAIGDIVGSGRAYDNPAPGFFYCDGRAISRTTYADLFNVIGTKFGSGDGSTTFNIPDMRGEFIRGAGSNSHANQGNGGTVGQHQDATNILRMNTYGTDLYTFIDTRSDRGVYGNNFDSESTNDGNIRTAAAANILTSYTSTPSVGGTVTTRPTNTSLNFFIKYKQAALPADFESQIQSILSVSELPMKINPTAAQIESFPDGAMWLETDE